MFFLKIEFNLRVNQVEGEGGKEKDCERPQETCNKLVRISLEGWRDMYGEER